MFGGLFAVFLTALVLAPCYVYRAWRDGRALAVQIHGEWWLR